MADIHEKLYVRCRVCSKKGLMITHGGYGRTAYGDACEASRFLAWHCACVPPVAGESLLERFELVIEA